LSINFCDSLIEKIKKKLPNKNEKRNKMRYFRINIDKIKSLSLRNILSIGLKCINFNHQLILLDQQFFQSEGELLIKSVIISTAFLG